MCEIIDQFISQGFAEGYAEGFVEGYARGFARGFAKGQNDMLLLVSRLFAQNRDDDVKKVLKDQVFRAELMKLYGIK